MNTHKKQQNPKQKQREKRNDIICTYHENTRLNRKMSRPCKICTPGRVCTLHWIPDRPDDHSCSRSWLRYNVFFLQSKKKKMVTPISVKQISSQIILTPYTASYSAYSCNLRLRLSSIETERRDEDISMHVTGSQWNCLKLATWFGSVAADISVLPLQKKIYLTNKLIFNMLVNEHLWILAVSGLGLLSVIFSGILNRC